MLQILTPNNRKGLKRRKVPQPLWQRLHFNEIINEQGLEGREVLKLMWQRLVLRTPPYL